MEYQQESMKGNSSGATERPKKCYGRFDRLDPKTL